MSSESDHKTYIITGAQASYTPKLDKEGHTSYVQKGDVARAHEVLLQGLECCCKDYNGELIILKMSGKDAQETIMHESLIERPEIYHGNRRLNSNIQISDIVVPPQNVDPSSGRTRFAQHENTLVYAHSKQRFKAIPASNCKLPKLLITTGAVTLPNYNISNHRGDVAFRDHTYGAVIVEVIDNAFYNVRHVRAQKDGKFVDLGRKYEGNKKPTHAKADSLVLGDLHVGDLDEITMRANYEMIEFFKPKNLILHDLFNGHSVNPHEKDNLITRVSDWKDGRLSLEKELIDCNALLKSLSTAVGKNGMVYVVTSNHDYFLHRYLERGEFLSKEPWNAEIALKLASGMVQGLDPIATGIEMMGRLPSNVDFLDLKSDFKRWGYQLASHGHLGNSGARKSSANSRETAHGKSITGHSHSPEVLRDTYIVGTSTRLDLPYTKGSASSWMAANAVLYEGGLVQLIPIINGKWKMKR
jgi:hypothetical protein